jgi:anti-sigma factor RsiW
MNRTRDCQGKPPRGSGAERGCGYLEQLSDFIDGDLAPELCAELERHMADCHRCQIVVDTLRRTVSLYHGLATEEDELPQEVEERLWQRFNLEDLLAQVQKLRESEQVQDPSCPD